MVTPTMDSLREQEWIDRYRLPTRGPDPIIHLFFCEEQVPQIHPKRSLSVLTEYQASYLSPQEYRPISITLVPGPADENQCVFWEIDRQLIPGLYGLQVPSFMRTRGYTYLYLHFSGARAQYLELHGVDYDPYDTFALGLDTWIRSTCHEHLTSGLRKSMPATLRPLLQDWFDRSI